jgi:hypothetical protein
MALQSEVLTSEFGLREREAEADHGSGVHRQASEDLESAARTGAEGLERIARILGRTASASITCSAQRHVQIVELTLQARLQTIAATGKGTSLRG